MPECSLLVDIIHGAKLWCSCSIQGPLGFLHSNALEGNIFFSHAFGRSGAEATKIAETHVIGPDEVKGFIV